VPRRAFAVGPQAEGYGESRFGAGPTSGRGSATNPSRFGILTLGRLVPSMTASAGMIPLRFSVHVGHRQAARLIERHCPVDVIPQRRRVWPEAADRFERTRRAQRASSADEPRADVAFAGRSVAARALGGEQLAPGRDRSRARRQALAVRRDGRSQLADLFGCWRTADAERGRLRSQRHGRDPRRRNDDEQNM
jgi:hypothetical protein